MVAAVAAVTAVVALGARPSTDRAPTSRGATGIRAVPLAFEANRGQAGAGVRFLTRGAGYVVGIEARRATLSFGHAGAVAMRLAGSRTGGALVGEWPLPGKVNYLLGSDPSRWLTRIPTYRDVRARSVYPGVDLVYHGAGGRLRYDFEVLPGGRPDQISLRFDGARRIRLGPAGGLSIELARGTIRHLRPRLYQTVDGHRRRVAGSFVLKGRRVGFAVGPYDRERPLVVDPTLVYSTYLGSGGDVSMVDDAVAADSTGAAYVAGYTFNLRDDAFVTKLSPAGDSIVYRTFIGGDDVDAAHGVAVDSSGNAYVTGSTSSADFPTTASALQPTRAGGTDAFVAKLNPAGDGFVYSTYLGGATPKGTTSGEPSGDFGADVAVDSAGAAYVTGSTDSADFPTLLPFQAANAGYRDAFVSKLSPGGSSLVYSTFLGGQYDDNARAIAIDASGSAYVSGDGGYAFPTLNAFQATNAGDVDAFAAKLNPTGSTLAYSTLIGGGNRDLARAIAVDGSGQAYVAGETNSVQFPTLNAFQSSLHGRGGFAPDAFVTKLASSGSALVYSTYLGGTGGDAADGLALDASGAAFVAGWSSSTDFPLQSSNQGYAGDTDAFVTSLAPAGNTLLYSTYLGGGGTNGLGYDQATDIALDAGAFAYVTGWTRSATFPTKNPVQPAKSSQNALDGFLTKLGPPPTAAVLRRFVARHVPGGVALRWQTGTERGLLGFHVYRNRGRISGNLVPAAGAATGATYTWLDRTPGRSPAVYRLQAIELDGSRTWLGRARVA